jgi:curved DNA-binding protein CbpA
MFRDQNQSFVDYYEVLQISSNADQETIGRIFRHLAKRYHPDNAKTADRDKFDRLVTAHDTLTDPQMRASYDVSYQENRSQHWRIVEEAGDPGNFSDDLIFRERLLSLLYVQRRRNVNESGLGNLELASLLGCPLEHLDFHIWFVKEKGWIQRLDNGMFAITASGVDEIEAARLRLPEDHLLGQGGSKEKAESPRQLENKY